MTPREQFIAWLNDAYSMELSLVPVLENHAKDAADYPEIQERIQRHAEETRRQSEQIENIITGLGGSVSTTKSIIGSLFGTGQSITTEFFEDEMIKNFISDFAAENFEIASYKSLIAAAEQIGEQGVVSQLQQILREEEEMARWLEERISFATQIGLEKATSASGS